MRSGDTIPIASAIRRWPRGGSLCALYWNVRASKLMVCYQEVTDRYRIHLIPDECVVNWLDHFVRDQSRLQPDSYYIADPPTVEWAAILKLILSKRKLSI